MKLFPVSPRLKITSTKKQRKKRGIRRMKITKKNMVIMMCTLAMVSMVPAAPVYAKTSQAYGAEARSTGRIHRR